MKKIFIFLFVMFLFGCKTEKKELVPDIVPKKTVEINLPDQKGGPYSRGYQILVIDSCEYIYAWFGQGSGGGSLTHKGNCKFCKERSKK